MTRQLIVNADDFGRTHGVSAGILRAHLEGIVTSATAMMNMPGVAADLRQAKTEAPRLGLGVQAGQVRVRRTEAGVRIEVRYAVPVDLSVYTVDLHFQATAGR